jgi:hypothetical protein
VSKQGHKQDKKNRLLHDAKDTDGKAKVSRINVPTTSIVTIVGQKHQEKFHIVIALGKFIQVPYYTIKKCLSSIACARKSRNIHR